MLVSILALMFSPAHAHASIFKGEALEKTFQSVAQASDVGEMFQYRIATPVTLGRQKSAMLPIVNESVQGEKVSIYNPAAHAKHPLNGLRLKNTTELHLMQGPITVFDDGAYAGDAQIQALPAGSGRHGEAEVAHVREPPPLRGVVSARVVLEELPRALERELGAEEIARGLAQERLVVGQLEPHPGAPALTARPAAG